MDDNIAISICNPLIPAKKCSSPNSLENCHSTCFITAYTGWLPVTTGICVGFRCLISFLMTLIQWPTVTGELMLSFISGNSVDVDDMGHELLLLISLSWWKADQDIFLSLLLHFRDFPTASSQCLFSPNAFLNVLLYTLVVLVS